MKKILTLAAAMMVAVGAYAQGTVNFANKVVGAVDAPITDGSGNKLAGAGFMAQLYAGPAGTAESSLTAISPAQAFASGAGAGYFVGGSRTIGSVAPGATARVEVRAWDVSTGATWEAAKTRGVSGTFDVATGGAGSPPSLPANLTGLKSFSIAPIPEPSTIALGVLGAAALLLRRRK